jgi:glycosyltransferase involved in cell wall biosynthesis
MKIGIIFEHEPSEGGAFYQAVASIKQFISAVNSSFEIVIYALNDNSYTELNRIGIQSVKIEYNFIESVKLGFKTITQKLTGIQLMNNILERKLIRDSVDLVYFLSPSYLATEFKKLNYISTVFDLCHLDSPEFPEIRDSNEFYHREKLFQNILPKSAIIVVNDESLKSRLIKRYDICENRIVIIPFDIVEISDEVISCFNMKLPERYLFYPAQFWNHKNHRRIIESIKILSDRGVKFNVIFTGSDRSNNQAILKSYSNELGISDLIQFEGFVSKYDLQNLYQNAFALIMPTYFGPTNLPPLEAWSNNCPVIYNKWFETQTKNAALYVDPDDANTFVDAILKLMDPEIRKTLISNGNLLLFENRNAINEGLKKIIIALQKHKSRIVHR